MKRVFVTPLDGKVIPLPDGNGDLPQEGKEVTASSFWYRRKSDGDVTISELAAVSVVDQEASVVIEDKGDGGKVAKASGSKTK